MEVFRHQACRGLCAIRGDTQIIEPHLAGLIAPLACEQARLESQQRQCVVGAHGIAKGLSGVGVEAAGQVDGEH